MTKLVITKERLYGRGAIRYTYVASIGMNRIASGSTKAEAEANAWQQIAETMETQMSAVGVAVANDGTVITVREYQTGQVETMHCREWKDGMYMGHGACMGQLKIEGKPVKIREYLAHELNRYNDVTRVETAA